MIIELTRFLAASAVTALLSLNAVLLVPSESQAAESVRNATAVNYIDLNCYDYVLTPAGKKVDEEHDAKVWDENETAYLDEATEIMQELVASAEATSNLLVCQRLAKRFPKYAIPGVRE